MKKVISLTTLLTVFSLVMFGARFTIKKGFETKPNSQLITELVEGVKSPVLAWHWAGSNPVVLGTSTSNQSTTVSNQADLTACRLQLVSKTENIRSVVDYMDKLGMDYTFENRTMLAEKFGIKDYVGSAEQNKKMIYLLAQQILCPGSKN